MPPVKRRYVRKKANSTGHSSGVPVRVMRGVVGKALADRGEAQAKILLKQDEIVLLLQQIIRNQKQIAKRLGIELAGCHVCNKG